MLSIDRGFENEDGQDITLEIKSDGPSPDDVMMKKQKVLMMKDVVEKLKPRYRRLVELRYYQELSYEEIINDRIQKFRSISINQTFAEAIIKKINVYRTVS